MNVRPSLEELQHKVHVAGDQVAVPEHRPGQVSALLGDRASHLDLLLSEATPVDRHRRAGGLACPRRGSGHLDLVRSQWIAVEADLPDNPGPDPRVSDADGDVPDDLVCQVLDGAFVHLEGMRLLGVPARPHDDVQPGRVRDPDEGHRVPADADAGQVDDRGAPVGPELGDLGEGRRYAGQAQVVGDGVLAASGNVEVLQRQLLVPLLDLGRRCVVVRGIGLPCRALDEQVLVHERDAELVRVCRPSYGHDPSGHVRIC